MRKIYVGLLLAFGLACGSLSASAQSVAVTESGKTVKRITFDRENVTLVYQDGTKDDNVSQTTIHREAATGIRNVNDNDNVNDNVNVNANVNSQYYTLDGRRLQSVPNGNGVYIKKEGKRVKKVKR